MALFRRRPRATPEPTESAPDEERRLNLPGGLFAPSGPAWFGSTAGIPVTMETALRDAATWACQRVIVSTVAMLPVHGYRDQGSRLVRLPDDPPIVRNPSGRVRRRGWVAQVIRSGVQSGNIYGHVVGTDNLGRATQIETVHPSSVSWQVERGEEVPYINGARRDLWPIGDLWHVPISQFLVPGSRVAMNPTDYGSTATGTALAAEDFGARFFGDSGHPTMVAKVATQITEDEALRIKQTLINAVRGNREPAVLGSGIELDPWPGTMKDAEFVNLLQFEVLQACRRYGVPPSMVYAAISGQSVTYSNVSQADLQFLKYSIQSWVADIEDAWSELVEPTQVRFTTEAVLAMDAISRAQLHETRLRTKTRTINEVRRIEDEEPFPDPIYDEPGIPAPAAGAVPAT